MRKFAGHLLGVWVINAFLLMLYLMDRPLYQEFVDAGAEMYSCIDWDAQGRSMPGVCADAPPAFPVR